MNKKRKVNARKIDHQLMIILSKEAVKAIVMAMENVGLDSTKFALKLGFKEDNSITMTFVPMVDYPYIKFNLQHGLFVHCDHALLKGVIVDYGNYQGKHGLIFVKDNS